MHGGSQSSTSADIYARKDSIDGPLEVISLIESLWYKLYVENYLLLEDPHLRQCFRQRFRLPYDSFPKLADKVSVDPLFERWCGCPSNNKKESPFKLLLLGSLWYLGFRWTFDGIEEFTAVSRDVHRCFLHKFIEFGSILLYNQFVVAPVCVNEAHVNMIEYAKAGFPGGVGSSDCTHIQTDRCEWNLKNNHLEAKSSQTTRTFNLMCNHCRMILHSTRGGPGRLNDMTMVRMDKFISGINDGKVLDDLLFELFAFDDEINVTTQKYKGVYVVVDNGYLDWSCTVPPFFVTNNIGKIRWSRWVESMRKDVECTFGILKGRWRTLKTVLITHLSSRILICIQVPKPSLPVTMIPLFHFH